MLTLENMDGDLRGEVTLQGKHMTRERFVQVGAGR
jgi:hypothetical protein